MAEILVTVRADGVSAGDYEEIRQLGEDLDWDFTKQHEQKIKKWDALKVILPELQKHYENKTARMQYLYDEQEEYDQEEFTGWPSSWEVELVIKLIHGKHTNVIWKDEGSIVEVIEWLDEKLQQH